MVEKKKAVTPSEAATILSALPVAPSTERVPVRETLGRVLAEDVVAEIPFPPFDRSPFDGYAFRAADTADIREGASVTLRINQEIPAGKTPTAPIAHGFAAKILTGAPIPAGADAVVKFEDTEFTADTVTLFAPYAARTNIVRVGEDIHKRQTLATKGSVVTSATMGMLATQGLVDMAVYKRPLLAIVNTGTELVEPGRPLPPGMIYNTSAYTLQGFCIGIGADFRDGGVVPDDADLISAHIQSELETADMVITTGGASVGDYDFALRSAEKSKGEILFWKTTMKPGGAMLAYTLGGKLVLALSGNPGAAALGLLRIGLPYVRKLSGRTDTALEVCEVFLKEELVNRSARMRVFRGRLELEGGRALFAENRGQGGGDISSFVGCNLLLEVPEGVSRLPAGTLVKAFRI